MFHTRFHRRSIAAEIDEETREAIDMIREKIYEKYPYRTYTPLKPEEFLDNERTNEEIPSVKAYSMTKNLIKEFEFPLEVDMEKLFEFANNSEDHKITFIPKENIESNLRTMLEESGFTVSNITINNEETEYIDYTITAEVVRENENGESEECIISFINWKAEGVQLKFAQPDKDDLYNLKTIFIDSKLNNCEYNTLYSSGSCDREIYNIPGEKEYEYT